METRQRLAWIVLAEAYGAPAVANCRPSAFAEANLRVAGEVLAALVDAYVGDRGTGVLSGLAKWKRPGSLGVASFVARAALWKQHRDQMLSPGSLPFQDPDFREWMDQGSFLRGLALRAFLPSAEMGDQGGDFPPGFNAAAAARKVDADIASRSLLRQLVLAPLGL